nr:UdgX family uracil-DNA binding protein [Phyllobacterium sp. 21LDTY02-6]
MLMGWTIAASNGPAARAGNARPRASKVETLPGGLQEVRHEAEHCTRCHLYKSATQTVFGEGPQDARIMFVGEQPGDQEDLAGQPFVGPAGKMLDAALKEAELDRSQVYVTNAVKHFKFTPRGKRRIHQKPNMGEIRPCRWWLEHELGIVKPKLVVALGATALTALMQRTERLADFRGRAVAFGDGQQLYTTVHPSYLLRIPDAGSKQMETAKFVRDMRQIRKLAYPD